MTLKDYCIDKNWSLFLDRDGVINRRRFMDYVRTGRQFRFLPGVTQAIADLSKLFGHIFVVTNQQGIGKGLMTEENLAEVHETMLKGIQEAGGRITRVYHSPYLEKENHIFRKPRPGMALKAREDFQGVDFTKSIMVGDSLTDMEFGKNLDMVTVFIQAKRTKHPLPDKIDFIFRSLSDFAAELTEREKL